MYALSDKTSDFLRRSYTIDADSIQGIHLNSIRYKMVNNTKNFSQKKTLKQALES